MAALYFKQPHPNQQISLIVASISFFRAESLSSSHPWLSTIMAKATQPIPWIYVFILTIFEPLMATSGALQVIFSAKSYLELANPNSVHLWNPAQQSIMTQIAGGWYV